MADHSTIDHTGLTGVTGSTELSYVQYTADVTPTTASHSTEANAITVVTAGAVVLDGSTVIEVEFNAPSVAPGTTSGDVMRFWLYDGGTSLGIIAWFRMGATGANGHNVSCHVFRRLTPSAASHTYSIRASVTGNNGIILAGAGGAGTMMPGFIRVKRV